MDVPRFESRQGQEVFLFCQTSKLVLGLTQPPIQWVSGSLTGVQVSGVWSWPPTSSCCWGAITLLPLNVFMAWTGTNSCFYFVPLSRIFCFLCNGELKQLPKLCSYSAAVTTAPLIVYMSAAIISSSICSTMTKFGVLELHIYLFMHTAVDSSI
jgi:hypothetical protein